MPFISSTSNRRSRSLKALVAAGVLGLGFVGVAAPAQAYSKGCTATTSGTFAVGQTVTGTSSTPATSQGWYQITDDGDGVLVIEIDPITSVASTASYVIQESDYGKQLFYYADGSGSTECISHVSPVVGRLSTPVSSQPTSSGKAKVGKTLSVSVGSVVPGTTVSYQWVRQSKAKKGNRVVSTPIPGATAATYKLKSKDRGKRVAAQVTYVAAPYNPTVLYTRGKKVH